MSKSKTNSAWLSAALVGAMCLPLGVSAEPVNRYGKDFVYHSEISASRAFAETVAVNGTWGKPSERPLIIDVRTVHEYAYGHPKGAINVPYPRIYRAPCASFTADGNCNGYTETVAQSDEDFVAYVQQLIKDKDRPIYTLCRTGSRSVDAANLLTNHGYTNVRNIWEGFVGQYKTYGGSAYMDLDHDGKLTEDDKDGWRYYAGLPYETKLLPHALYQPYAYKYYEYAQ